MTAPTDLPLDYEWYRTPHAAVRWLLESINRPLPATILCPCVGDGRIVQGLESWAYDAHDGRPFRILTNDLDPQWSADFHLNAADGESWEVWLQELIRRGWGDGPFAVIENPPYSIAWSVLWHAWHSTASVIALHVRLSFLEALKTLPGKNDFLAERPPTLLLHLPRYPYRKNARGKYNQDSLPSCWLVWDRTAPRTDRTQMLYPPQWVFDRCREEHLARLEAEKAEASALARRGEPGA